MNEYLKQSTDNSNITPHTRRHISSTLIVPGVEYIKHRDSTSTFRLQKQKSL